MWGCGDVDGMFNDGHDISCPYEGIDAGMGGEVNMGMLDRLDVGMAVLWGMLV